MPNSFLTGIRKRWTRQIGIDLGTSTTLVHVEGRGVVLHEPSMAAISQDTGELVATGEEAKRLWGRAPFGIGHYQPIRKGVIADYEQAELMLRSFLSRIAADRGVLRTTAVVGIPGGVSEVERRAVREATLRSGASDVYLAEESLAAAIGCGVPPTDPIGTILIDLGAGTTEMAVIVGGEIAYSRTIRFGGDDLDAAVAGFVRRARGLAIGERTAEQLKIDLGSASPMSREYEVTVKGRDLHSGMPKAVGVSSGEVRAALAEPLQLLTHLIRTSLEEISPEMSSDALEKGIVLTGGGALLQGIDRFVATESGLKVLVADDPQSCVVRGTGYLVERLNTSRAVRRMLERASRN